MPRCAAIALLHRRAPHLTDAHAGQLAERLGDLPLALARAAAYLDQTSMSAPEYLRLLDTHSADQAAYAVKRASQAGPENNSPLLAAPGTVTRVSLRPGALRSARGHPGSFHAKSRFRQWRAV
jgi:hypothetical protein